MDGVLNEYGNESYHESKIPKIRKGAKKFLEELSEYDDTINEINKFKVYWK